MRLFSTAFTKSIIPTADKTLKLAKYVMQPTNVAKPIAYVGILHGYSEHMGNYESLANTLTNQGFCVFGYDRRGRGHSEGVNGLVTDPDTIMSDLITIKNSIGAEKVSLIGNSLGGLIACYAGLKAPQHIKSIVTINPALGNHPNLVDDKSMKIKILKMIMGTPLIGCFNIGKFNMDTVSTDKAVIDKFMKDPLNYKGPIKGLSGKHIYKMQDYCENNMKNLNVPWLLELSTLDKCVDAIKTAKLFDAIVTKDKAKNEFPSGHDLPELDNKEAKEMRVNISRWLYGHI